MFTLTYSNNSHAFGMRLLRALRSTIRRGPGVIAAALVALVAGCSTTQTLAPSPSGAPRDLGAEIRAEFNRSVAGWNAGNLDLFMSIYADDATFAMRDSFIKGYDAIRAYYAPQFLPGAVRGILNLDLNIEILDPDLALVRAIYDNTQAGQTTRGTSTLLLRYRNGHWRVIHDHST